MFHKYPLKDWSFRHLVDYGWYLDCPKDNIPSSKILFRKRNDHGFQQPIMNSI